MRRALAPELLAYADWPAVNEKLLEPEARRRFLRLKRAVEAACQGKSGSYIEKKFGVSPSRMNYLLARCTTTHEDGRLAGYRALIKWFRMESGNTRTAEVVPGEDGAGMAGAFQKMLRDYPKLHTWLDGRIKPARGKTFKEAGLKVSSVHGELLDKLRQAGVRPGEYPFFPGRAAYESLAAYIRKKVQEGDDEVAVAVHGDSAQEQLQAGTGKTGLTRPLVAFERVAYDEYMLPNIATLVLEMDGKEIDVPLSRGFFCPIVDFKSTGILGYSISVAERFSTMELLRSYECTLNPPAPTDSEVFKDLPFLPNEGLPAAVVPGARGRRICILALDNHLTHLADAVVGHLRNRTGVIVTFGQVKRWITRACVERIFSEFQQQLARIPSTTGSGPGDPAVSDPTGNAVRYRIRFGLLRTLLDKLVARHNARAFRMLKMRTPVEVIAADVAASHRLSIVPGFSETFLSDPSLAVEVEIRTVRGSRSNGVRPYIEIDEADYTNDILEQSWSMIGSKLLVHIPRDMRTVKAFNEDGSEFGVLGVVGHWRDSAHDRSMRKTINKLYRTGILKERGNDPVAHFNRYLAQQAALEAKSKPKRISRSAGTLARSMDVGGTTNFRVSVDEPSTSRLPSTKPRGRRAFFGDSEGQT